MLKVIKNGFLFAVLLLYPAVSAGGETGRVDFFLCDHDVSETYLERLSSFVKSHSVLFLDFAPTGGVESGLNYQKQFHDIASGKAGAESFVSRMGGSADKSVNLLIAIARGVEGTGKQVYMEAALWPPDVSERIGVLWAARKNNKAFEALSGGDVEKAVALWNAAQKADMDRMDLRDEYMLKNILDLKGRYPDADIGVIAGAFHTWPYLRMKEALDAGKGKTYALGYEFMPKALENLTPHSHLKHVAESGETVCRTMTGMILSSVVRAPVTPERQMFASKLVEKLSFGDLRSIAAAFGEKKAKSIRAMGDIAVGWLLENGKLDKNGALTFDTPSAVAAK